MKSVFVLFAVLALSCNAAFASDCVNLPQYSSNVQIACEGQEIYYLWPNYANSSQYYRCQGEGNPVVGSCPAATPYFSYVFQSCQDCANLIPAPACAILNIGSNSKCVPINAGGESGGQSEPTPIYPPSTAAPAPAPTTTTTSTTTPKTTVSSTTSTTTPKSTVSSTTSKTTETTTATTTATTTTTQAPSNNDIPPPPSPATPNPNVPSPPIQAPTPPNIIVTPPNHTFPNSV